MLFSILEDSPAMSPEEGTPFDRIRFSTDDPITFALFEGMLFEAL